MANNVNKLLGGMRLDSNISEDNDAVGKLWADRLEFQDAIAMTDALNQAWPITEPALREIMMNTIFPHVVYF